MAARSVLVTGGNGFIGRHLVRRLVRDGCAVSVLQRSPDQIDLRTECLRLSRFDADGIAAVLGGRRFDWVFHLLSYGVNPHHRDPRAMFEINVAFTQALVDLISLRSPRAVVMAGSGAEYDLSGADRPIAEHHPLETRQLYGASKAAATLCAAALATARDIPFAACRLFGVYGPEEAAHRLSTSLLRGARSGDRIPLSPGAQQRDFIFVDDVVEAMVGLAAVLESDPRQVIVNVATGRPIAVRRFVETAAAIFGIAENQLGFGDIAVRPGEAKVFSGDPSRLHGLTGWTATVGLTDGLRRCLDWQPRQPAANEPTGASPRPAARDSANG